MAHELIHASHFMSGIAKNHWLKADWTYYEYKNGKVSKVTEKQGVEEYTTVGLDGYGNGTITENDIRAEHHIARRTAY